MSNRAYTSRRMAIVDALVEKIKEIKVDYYFGMRFKIFRQCI
jgi:hypothetical protein